MNKFVTMESAKERINCLISTTSSDEDLNEYFSVSYCYSGKFYFIYRVVHTLTTQKFFCEQTLKVVSTEIPLKTYQRLSHNFFKIKNGAE